MSRRARRIVFALISSQIAFTVPWLVFGGLSGNPLSGTAILAVVSVVVACVMAGLRAGALVVLPLAAVAGVGVAWADVPVLAALLVAGAAFARGVTSRRGMQNAFTMSVITLGFVVAQPTPANVTGSLGPAWATALVVVASATWGLLLMWIGRASLPSLPLHPVDDQHATWFALLTAGLTGIAAFVVSSQQLAHAGGWFIMTILIVVQPYAKDSVRKSLERGAGTALGFVLAFVIGALIDGRPYQASIGALLGAAAMLVALFLLMTRRPYWVYASAMTFAIVLLEGSATSILATDLQRLWATLAGVAFAVLVTLLLAPVGRRLTRQPDTASAK